MKRFFLSVRPEIDELPIQQRVNLLVLYSVALASLVVVPFNLASDLEDGNLGSVFFLGLYLAFVTSGLVTFFLTRSVRQARTLVGFGIFLLGAYLVIQAGGPRGTGLFYFVSAFSLLYFVLGYWGGILFASLFFAGLLVRVGFFPVPPESLFYDDSLAAKFVLIFGVASALGIISVVYQNQLVRHLARIAYRDAVTGLSNRNQVAEHLELSVHDGLPFALVAVKLFHFDEFSAHRGMAAGDAALRVLGDRIRARLPAGALAGRWSGTLFLVRLTNIDLPTVQNLCQILTADLQETLDLDGTPASLHPAMAITRFPDDGFTIDRLVANLTLTLGHSDDHVGQVRLFNEEAWSVEQRRFRVAAALKGALERGEFSLVYQPKVRLIDGYPHGAEVLVRWTHPELGSVSPGEFVPIAEAEGLIHALTWFVIDQFLDDLSSITDAWGNGPFPGPHAINLSPIDLGRSELPQQLAARLAARRVPTASMELEITEGVMMSGDPHVKGVLRELKDLGFRLAIDDFGTGYSSLSYLHRLEADGLKIDQSFIRNLGSVSAMPPIVDAVISMGLALGMDITAEGVETEAQAEYLVSQGCQLAQGWLYSRPLTLENYRRWLDQRRPKVE